MNFVKVATKLGFDKDIIQNSLEKRALWQLLVIPAGIAAGGMIYNSDVDARKRSNLERFKANLVNSGMGNLIVGGGLGGGMLGYMQGEELFPDYSPTMAKLLGTSLGSTLGSVGGALAHHFTTPNIKV